MPIYLSPSGLRGIKVTNKNLHMLLGFQMKELLLIVILTSKFLYQDLNLQKTGIVMAVNIAWKYQYKYHVLNKVTG